MDSKTVTQISKHIQLNWQTERLAIVTSATVTRDEIDLWFAFMQGLKGQWNNPKPLLIVNDFSLVANPLSPTFKSHYQEYVTGNRNVPVYEALVLDPLLPVGAFVRTLYRPPHVVQEFKLLDKALAWVQKQKH